MWLRLWMFISALWLIVPGWIIYQHWWPASPQQKLAQLALALLPPVILYPIGAAIGSGFSGIVSDHVRRGLARLYAALSIPWVAWFGYMAYEAHSDAKRLQAIYTLFLVPLGGPLLCIVALWIVAGFRKSAESKSPGLRSEADYQVVIDRAVSDLASNTPEARQALYDRARSVLVAQLHAQDMPAVEIAREQRALEAAMRKASSRNHPLKIRAKDRDQLIAAKPSTVLLIVSVLFFHRVWLIDVTCMSVWWVARLPRPREAKRKTLQIHI
jgi:hypothetical protein